jgi:hypothetical protein
LECKSTQSIGDRRQMVRINRFSVDLFVHSNIF